MMVVGVNAPPRGWHDTAACLVKENGIALAFTEEERLCRVKHALGRPPHKSVQYCLKEAGIQLSDIDVLAVGWDVPKVRAHDGHRWRYSDRLNYARYLVGPASGSGSLPELVFVPHHRAHAAAAFYASPFERAAVLVVDGAGEDESVTIFRADRAQGLVALKTWPYSFSLGLLYDAASRAVGFSHLEAGKTMGLASYGLAEGVRPEPLFDLRDAADAPLPSIGTYQDESQQEVNDRWLAHFAALGMVARFRSPELLHEDRAAVRAAWSAQAAVEQAVTHLALLARRLTGLDELCLSGGVALNVSANVRVPEPLFIPPMPHDAGVALGAAWCVTPLKDPQTYFSPFLGTAIDRRDLLADAAPYDVREVEYDAVVDRLLRGEVGAVVEGRAEMGPRALGHRSIIALPTPGSMRTRINRMKSREPWRPLAPVGLPCVDGVAWDSRPRLAQYMLGAVDVNDALRNDIEAAVHVDGTTRSQIVKVDECSTLASLLQRLSEAGRHPILINTSLNYRGEPICDSLKDAITVMKRLGLDFLLTSDSILISKH